MARKFRNEHLTQSEGARSVAVARNGLIQARSGPCPLFCVYSAERSPGLSVTLGLDTAMNSELLAILNYMEKERGILAN